MAVPGVYQPSSGLLREKAVCFSSPALPPDTMKVCITAILTWLTALPSLLHFVSGEQPINCLWGPYGNWTECDGCTKTQTRTRHVQVFAQFGGVPCLGEPTEKRECVPTKGCPLDLGCGERFRCSSGQCISMALVCNGDQDCEEDGLDEQNCPESSSSSVCDNHRVPPNIELTGKGFDILTGELRSGVINTKSFGGQCRNVFSGDHRNYYRLPQSTLGYSFQVSVENDFSDEFYNSSWSYMKHTENRETFRGGHRYKTFHNELTNDKAHRLLIVRNEVEVAQFQNSPPEYLPLSEEFWKALSALPTAYEASAYRSLIRKYGTHFLSEGSLGGQYQLLLQFDAESMKETSSTDTDYHKCVTKVKRRLFRKKTTTKCEKLIEHLKSTKGFSKNKIPVKTDVLGGDPAYVAGLGYVDLEDPGSNSAMYSKWAGSVKNFPQVIKQKLRPLYELVKEVPCASVKRLLLRRAVQDYLEEDDPCHCRPCQNNGHVLLRGTSCTCICPADTSGLSCQHGMVLEEQPGVIHGDWSCWSAWTSCSEGRRSRTRSCSNPSPKMGGKHCIGETVELQLCPEQDLQHQQMMESHCFHSSLKPEKVCKTPPPLRNGFVMDPKDVYAIGSKIVYSCIEGHHIIGDPVAVCTDQQTWRKHAVECKSTVCRFPPLRHNVTGAPWKLTYQIGEKVSLLCPPGTRREGAAEIACDSSLHWSPSAGDVRCQAEVSREVPEQPKQQCKPWEKAVKDHCVCKLPYECSSSLEVCATGRRATHRVSVCKVKALQCLGQTYTLAEDSACDWPKREAAPCPDCPPWEKCEEGGTVCTCREVGQCPEPGTHLCVRLGGEDAVAVTMAECEAGIRRCRGDPITIVALGACSS
ncbi:complement component 7b [Anguilla rostrata]|uniref:complement component 7b n=1 Tax=Anguilla rostrata TaxID=7938 RepID=UPI0030CB7F70